MVEFRLLGPVEMAASGAVIAAGPPQQRLVLAALAVDADRQVTTETLVDRVWGDDPPERARRTLQAHVARIRRLLERAGAGEERPARLVRRSGGYLLDVDRGQVDLLRFRFLVDQARTGTSADIDRVARLREALELWRGPPLAGLPGQWAERMRKAWSQQHLDAVVAWAQAELRVGNAEGLIGRLTELVDEHPLVEPLAALLMQALDAAGRRSHALDQYLTTRRRLVDELGTEPGTELRTLHRAILREDRAEIGGVRPPTPRSARTAPAPPGSASPGPGPLVPAQLPPDVYGFVGRDEEIARLDEALTSIGRRAAAGIWLLSGTAGVGKTALAVHWGHRVRTDFPDGQLYIELHGYAATPPVRPLDALNRILRALGVAADRIPLQEEEAAAAFRSTVAGRRMLVVVDNAHDAEQVRPLLPGTCSCVVVVTSRDRLPGLVARDGAQRIDLDLLPPGDAVGLLRTLIGRRADDEPAAVTALADICARLPLALRIAAELATAQPVSVLSDLVGGLAEERRRLAVFDAGDDPRTAVRAVFSWSYDRLPPEAAGLFRVLGLHPGGPFDEHAAAALAGVAPDSAGHQLRVLARTHLLEPDAGGRFAMHDLLHAYAADLAADETDRVRRDAQTRLFDYYLTTASAAVAVAFPPAGAPSPPSRSSPGPGLFSSRADAKRWLDRERATLVACAGYTLAHDRPLYTCRFAATLKTYLLTDGHYSDAVAVHRHAVAAYRLLGDRAGEAEATGYIGTLLWRLGRSEEALSAFREVLDIRRGLGDLAGEAASLNNLGLAYHAMGYPEQAADHLHRALALHRQGQDREREAGTLLNLGLVEAKRGRYPGALDLLTCSLAGHRELGARAGEASALGNLGKVHYRLGRYDEAAEHHERALEIFTDLGRRASQAEALDDLGAVLRATGRPAEAIDRHERALALARDIGTRSTEAAVQDNLGQALRAMGRYEQAARHHREALALAREVADRSLEAAGLNSLGETLRAAGRAADALDHHHRARVLARDVGDAYEEVRADEGIGCALFDTGHLAEANATWFAALKRYAELGVPEAHRLALRLAPSESSSD
jgi:DNA-binding SARP family transcriptional activator/tetratricopeptide (TPR) repeat protein